MSDFSVDALKETVRVKRMENARLFYEYVCSELKLLAEKGVDHYNCDFGEFLKKNGIDDGAVDLEEALHMIELNGIQRWGVAGLTFALAPEPIRKCSRLTRS